MHSKKHQSWPLGSGKDHAETFTEILLLTDEGGSRNGREIGGDLRFEGAETATDAIREM
jgi:hypothetical protein